MSDGLLAVHGSAYGTNGCREMFCPLVRFRRKADVPSSPVAALAHSRFWHSADMPAVAFDVRFRGQGRHGLDGLECPLLTQPV
jgi:hypothetical protein